MLTMDDKSEEESNTVRNADASEEVLFINLPTEIIADILSRLPAQVIFECQIVCKNFNRLTQQPHFKELQSIRGHPRRVYLFDCYARLFCIHLESSDSNGTLCGKIKYIRNVIYNYHSSIRDFSNGILASTLFYSSKEVRISNPLTNGWIEVPVPNFKGTPPRFGFGYDAIIGKYKAILVCNVRDNRDYQTKGEIITLGEYSWRTLTFPFNVKKWDLQPVVLEGNFYWLINIDRRKYKPSVEGVLVFNITTEKFKAFTIRFPALEQRQNLKLISFGESLALIEYNVWNKELFRVWRVFSNRDHGDRVQEYACDVSAIGRQFQNGILFLGMLRDGSLLFQGERWTGDNHHVCNDKCFHIAMYFPLTKTWVVPHVVADQRISSPVGLFVPSLVCPSTFVE